MADLSVKYDLPSRFAWGALYAVLAVLPHYGVLGQSPDPCERAITAAETQYVEGRYDEVLATLSECIRRDNVLVRDIVAAYRLTTLAYLRMGEVEEARSSVIELLNRVPEYEPDPIQDIPSYVALVNLVKEALQLDAATLSEENALLEEPEARRRSWFQSKKGWLLAGGSAALVGVVAAIAMGGGGESGPETLPRPPAVPD